MQAYPLYACTPSLTMIKAVNTDRKYSTASGSSTAWILMVIIVIVVKSPLIKDLAHFVKALL